MATRRILFFLGAVIGVTFAIAFLGIATRATNDDFSFDAAKLTDTAVWTKVNDKPYMMGVTASVLCGLPSKQHLESERKKNPHAASFITVYVNNAGKEAMFAKDAQTFPEGSVIVKEKFGNYLGGKAQLYTIMRKREAGFNPDLGDWEFAVIGPNGKDV